MSSSPQFQGFFKHVCHMLGILVNAKRLSFLSIVLSRIKYIAQYISKAHMLDRSFCFTGKLYNF